MVLYYSSKSRIRINWKTSKDFDVTKGVLQGDTLAPFLFIIVQNLEIKVYKRTLTKYSEIWTLQTTSCYWMKIASQQLDTLFV